MLGGNMTTIDTRKALAVVLAVVALTGMVTPALAVSAASTGPADLHAGQSPSTDGQASVGTPAEQASIAPPDRNETATVTTTNVTLVTGQTVTVVEQGNETTYQVHSPGLRKVETRQGTYVFPQSVDFTTFEPALFNVDQLVAQNYTDADTDSVPIIVERRETAGPFGLESFGSSLAAAEGVETKSVLGSANAVASSVSKADASAVAARLRADPSVERVHLDSQIELNLDEANELVSAPSGRQQYNVTGTNVTVAVVDSGVDNSHPMLEDAVVDEADMVEHDGVAQDTVGHGTHVAGIVAGRSVNGSNITGIAPNASIMDVRVGDYYLTESDIIEGVEYAVTNDADIISMSLGGSPSTNDPLVDAVQNASDNGVTVVVAAGNDGSYGRETIGSPGVAPEVITVGASDKSDRLAYFSSRGPTSLQHYVKPDLVAPGVDIESAAQGRNGTTTMSGTSMATPAVSGAAALLIAEHPDWNQSQVRSALVTTTDRLDASYDVYQTGSGRLNVSRALGTDLLVSPSTVQFGLIDGSASKNVTLHNDGDENRTLSLDASVRAVSGSGSGTATLGTRSVTLAPNETATVELTVTATGNGFFSGRLAINDSAATGNESWRRASFGFVSQRTVTVHSNGLNGTSVEGDVVTINDGYYTRSIGSLDENGTYTATGLPNGTYTVTVHGTDESANNQSVLSLATVNVTGDTTVTVNESDTVRFRFDTSNLSGANESLSVLQRDVTAELDGVPFRIDAAFPESTTFRVSNISDLNVSTHHIVVPSAAYPNETRNLDTPELYDVVNATWGVDGPVTYAPTREALAVKNITYHRTDPGVTIWVARHWGITNRSVHESTYFVPYYELDGRTDQTIYASQHAANESVEYAIEGVGYWWWTDDTTSVVQDGTNTTLNRYPLLIDVGTPEPDYGKAFNVESTTIDQAGRALDGIPEPDHCELYRNGTQVDDWGSSWCWDASSATEAVAPNGTTYRYMVEGDFDRAGWDGRTRAVYETTVRNGSYSDVPEVTTIDFAELDANNSLPKRPVSATITADQNLTNATVYVRYASNYVDEAPYEGDVNTTNFPWREADVQMVDASAGTIRATLDTRNVTDGPMHISVTVVDEEGDRYTVTARQGADTTWDRNPDRNITATVLKPDGNVSNTTEFVSWYDGTTDVHDIDENGTTSFTLPNRSSPTLWVAETDRFGYDTEAPIDGIADVHTVPVGTIENDTDLGTVTLPEGHRLNVTVVTDRGNPVSDAQVFLIDVPNGTPTHGQGLKVGGRINGTTDANGSLVVGNTTGLEANGTVRVDVIIPDKPQFPESLNATDVTVTNATNHTVVLETQDVWAPDVSNVSATLSDRTIAFEFDANETIGSIEGAVQNSAGVTVEQLDLSDFTRNESHYAMNYTPESGGDYSVVITEIADTAGNSDFVGLYSFDVPAKQTNTGGGGGGGGGGQGGGPAGTVKISDWSVSDSTVTPGEQVTMSVTVSNTADSTKTITPALYVDGELVEGKRLSVLKDMERTVKFTYRFEESGTHSLSPDGNDFEFVTVEAAGETTTTTETTTATTTPVTTTEPGDGGESETTTTTAVAETTTATDVSGGSGDGLGQTPGFGVTAMVGALVATLLLARRRD